MSESNASVLPVEQGRTKGYSRESVDTFLEHARSSFDSRDSALTSQDVREASFPITKGGYRMTVVDSALARLEDTLAECEKRATLAELGPDAWLEALRGEAKVLLVHARRPATKRFHRVSKLKWGYAIDEVDVVCDRIAAYLRNGTPLTASQVRGVAFTMQHGGYNEAQVDALLDATVELLLKIQ